MAITFWKGDYYENIYIIFLLIGFASGQISFSGKGEVVAVRYLELKDNVSIKDFEKFAMDKYNPSFNRVVPGLKIYIAKSDRVLL